MTDQERQILAFVIDYIEREQFPPTLADIGLGIGWGCQSTISKHLDRLQEQGFIKRRKLGRRIEVLKEV